MSVRAASVVGPVEEGPVDDAQADGYICSMRSGMNSPVSRKKNGNHGLAEDLDDLRRVEGAPDVAQERQFIGILRDARDQEERVEDDHDRAEDQGGLHEAEEAADDLVREARLLEERLGLVEALDDEGERDRRGDEDHPETDHVAVLGGELSPVGAEELGERSGEARRQQEREQDREDAEQAPDGPLGESEHEEPDEVQDDQQVDRPDPADEFAKFQGAPPWVIAHGRAGAAQG